MKAARLVVLGVAVAAGGIAAYLAAEQQSASAATAAAAGLQLETVDVLVAKTDLEPRSGDRELRISVGRLGRRPRPIRTSSKNPTGRTRIDEFRRRDRARRAWSPAIRSATRCGDGQGLGLHGRGAAARHAGDRDRYFAGNRRRRLHPAGRPGRRRARRAATRPRRRQTGVEKFVSDTILSNVRVLAMDQNIEEKNGTKDRARQDRDAGIDRAAGRDARAVASARHDFAHAAQHSRLAIGSGGRRRRHQQGRRGTINTVRFGVSTLGTGR